MTLIDIVSSKRKAEMLRLLFGIDDRGYHLRELARQSGLALRTVQEELARLTKAGLVRTRRDGNRLCYEANKENPVYGDLRNIVLKTAGLVGVLQRALDVKGIELAFVFGSLATGNARPDSDLDLMVVGSVGLRQAAQLLSGLAEKLGREVNPHVLTRQEFLSRKKAGDHFISAVLASPRLYVIGSGNELAKLGQYGWLRVHQTSRQEVRELLAMVDRDLADAESNISNDWRFGIAYNAALKLCTVLLYASGYRPEKVLQHYRTITALPLILGEEHKPDVDYLDACRMKRNTVEYDRVGGATGENVEELVEFTKTLRRLVLDWLRQNHPQLVPPDFR